MDSHIKIELWIGFFFLVLSMPVTIAVHLLTPRLQDWYAATTQRRLRKQLKALEEEYDSVKDKNVFNEAEEAIFTNGVSIVLVVTGSFQFILAGPVVVLGALHELFPALRLSIVREAFALFIVVALMNQIVMLITSSRASRIRRRYTSDGRKQLFHRIVELREKADKNSSSF